MSFLQANIQDNPHAYTKDRTVSVVERAEITHFADTGGHTVYHISVQLKSGMNWTDKSGQTLTAGRRYSELARLHARLIQGVTIISYVPRIWPADGNVSNRIRMRAVGTVQRIPEISFHQRHLQIHLHWEYPCVAWERGIIEILKTITLSSSIPPSTKKRHSMLEVQLKHPRNPYTRMYSEIHSPALSSAVLRRTIRAYPPKHRVQRRKVRRSCDPFKLLPYFFSIQADGPR